jgi:hexokinase
MQDLSQGQLEEIRDALSAKVRLGLSKPNQEVLCLPAYLAPPSRELQGEAIVVDAGGTNMRAAWLDLRQDTQFLAGPLAGTLPDGRQQEVGRGEFFGAQAKLIAELRSAAGKAVGDSGQPISIGYCFSYAAEVLPNRDAKLLYWTKGIQVKDVIGTEVGQGLREALDSQLASDGRSGRTQGCAVLNDTVAALMGGAFLGRERHQNFIGLIVGTGTNMASFVPRSEISKLGPASAGEAASMAVNLESGNFHPPHLEKWDDLVDQASNNVGKQRFEKAVSGLYLGEVFQRLYPNLAGFDPNRGAAQVVEAAESSDNPEVLKVANYVLHRSADLTAAALASLYPLFPSGSLGICAEGGLFWGAKGYAQRVESSLQRLLPENAKFEILRQDNVNLIGSACAALV